MLGRLGAGQYRVRLAGGFVADLHGRELRGENFPGLWRPDDRMSLQLTLEAMRRYPDPVVVDADARAGEFVMQMEVLLAPVRASNGQVDRVLGLYQPISPAAALMGGTVNALNIRGVTSTAANIDQFPRLRLASIDGRRIA